MRPAIEVEAPTEEALTAYLAANAKTYEAPEYRSITLLTWHPRIWSRDRGQRRRPAGRLRCEDRSPTASRSSARFEQLLAPDEATIKRAADMVAAGQSFTQVAAALKDARVERSELGPLAQGRPARGRWTRPLGSLAAGRRERARCRRRSAGTCCAPSRSCPSRRSRSTAGQGRAAPRARARARDQPAARSRHPAGRRARRRHAARGRGGEARHRAR